MQYTAAVPFDGDTGRAFDLALSALTSIGFRLAERDGSSLELTGPGMNSTRQSPLVGASRIRVARGGSELTVEAELGGVRRMARFVTLFPLGLCLALGIALYAVFHFAFGEGVWVVPVVAVTGGNALLWLLLGPILARVFRARTCRGLDALLHNMAAAGGNSADVTPGRS